MRALPYVLIMLLAALQALLATAWMKAGIPQQFTSVLLSFYGTVPDWTAFAFSLGWYWVTLPLASLAWLLLAWQSPPRRRHAWPLAIVSLVSFVSMIYAMYPLHLMGTSGII